MPNLKEILRLYGNAPDQCDVIFDKTKSDQSRGWTSDDLKQIVQNTKSNLPFPVFDETNGSKRQVGTLHDIWVEDGDKLIVSVSHPISFGEVS